MRTEILNDLISSINEHFSEYKLSEQITLQSHSNELLIVNSKGDILLVGDSEKCHIFLMGISTVLGLIVKSKQKATDQLIFGATASVSTEAIIAVDEEDKWTRENK